MGAPSRAAGSWEDLLVPGEVAGALRRAGFAAPAEVQARALPAGRAGADLLVQSRAGSGKTLAFAALALERAAGSAARPHPRALVVVPTHEVARQTAEVCGRLAAGLAEERGPAAARVQCAAFVGGVPLARDAERLKTPCHVAFGTPGRLRALVEGGAAPGGGPRLCVDFVQLLVLDEADRLLAGGFDADLAGVLNALPKRLQTAAFSATYPPELRERLRRLLRPGAEEILLCENGLRLPAVRHFFVNADTAAGAAPAGAALAERKVAALLRVLRSVSFHQALVFLNQPVAAQVLAEELSARGFPARCVAAARGARLRAEAMRAARGFRVRVLIATDLLARGVDLSRVSLVVNLDLPGGSHAGETLVHRLGRTGRFGARGVAVSVVAGWAELERLRGLLRAAEGEGREEGVGRGEWLSLEPEELPQVVPAEWSEGQALEGAGEKEAWERLRKAEAQGAQAEEAGRNEAGQTGKSAGEGPREGGGHAFEGQPLQPLQPSGSGAAGPEGEAPLREEQGATALPFGQTPPPKIAGDGSDEAYLRWLWWDWRWRWYLSLTPSSRWHWTGGTGAAEHLHG